jgi:ATP-binding cassette subfamily F protein 3
VSHDRYFISKVANKIWEIVDGEIKEFKGTYQEWVEWKERMAAKNVSAKKEEKPTPAPAPEKKPQPQNNAPVNKELKKELQKQQRLFQQAEEKIAQLKQEKLQLEAELGSSETYSDKQRYTATEARYNKVVAELNQLNIDYEKTFEKIVELEGKNNS